MDLFFLQDLFKESIFFVTTDVKRALGPENLLPNYHIICSTFEAVIPVLRRQGARIYCLEEELPGANIQINNSGKLLEHPKVTKYIAGNSPKKPWIMVFKPSLKIDLLARDGKYNLICNGSSLNTQLENKINFHILLNRHFPRLSVPAITGTLGKLVFENLKKRFKLPLVLQFGYGWAGKTTFFITDELEFSKLQTRFYQTEVKISKFIYGRTALNNCCLYQDKLYFSPPAVQINGFPQLSENPSATCGRQWSLKSFSENESAQIAEITRKFSALLVEKNYQGYFGLDFLIEENTGNIYLAEINARLTASSAFYTKIELKQKNIPLLFLHLGAFLDKSFRGISIINSRDPIGSQLIIRTDKLANAVPPKDYGVYKVEKDTVRRIRDDYYPQNLQHDEFILLRSKFPVKKDSEKARIESTSEVLESSGRLTSWVLKLF